MPVILPQAPPAAVTAVSKFVSSLSAGSSPLDHLPKLRQELSTILSSSAPTAPLALPVYNLGVDDVLKGQGLSSLKPALWTHVISQRAPNQRSVATVQTDVATSEVQSLSERPTPFWDALDRLRALPEVARADYDIVELRVPALHVEALLLRSRTPDADVAAPFLSHVDGVKVGQTYKLADFLASLRPAAQSVSGMSTGTDTGG